MNRKKALWMASVCAAVRLGWASEIRYVVVDDHTTPVSCQSGGYYNRIGGDRFKLRDFEADPTNGVAVYRYVRKGTYRAECVRLKPGEYWGCCGKGYALNAPLVTRPALNPNALFHPMIKAAYQPVLVGVDVVVSKVESPAGRSDLSFRIELKGFDSNGAEVPRRTVGVVGRSTLLAGPFPRTFSMDVDPATLGTVGMVTWILDRTQTGDAIAVDQVRLRVQMQTPTLDPKLEAFVWSFAMALNNYDDATGMAGDRANFPKTDFENVTASCALAKLIAEGIALGVVDETQGKKAIMKIANTMLTIVPRGPAGIWPHFTRNGGTERIPDVEWSSGDTAYAALDLLVTLQAIGDPAGQIPGVLAFLRGINWRALKLPDGSISHGYTPAGTLLPYGWRGFGAETVGVLLACLIGGGDLGIMDAYPTDNGSGFILNAQYPILFTGRDRWGNDWDALRRAEAATQVGWYKNAAHANATFAAWGFFGLSAGECPEGWNTTNTQTVMYQAYGIGGRYSAPNDGSNSVCVLHYSGMIASIETAAALNMWTQAVARGYVSPLNNMESIRVNPQTGDVTVNSLRGTWNLALQAEGWAWCFPEVTQAVMTAYFAIPEVAAAHGQLFPPTASAAAQTNDYIVVSDGANLFAVPLDRPDREFQITTNTMPCRAFDHPNCVDAKWLYFDAIDQTPGEKVRRGLWRMSLSDRNTVERLTSDPWGNSNDTVPIYSAQQPGAVYLSNRTGITRLQYLLNSYQGPGYGYWGGPGTVAVWSTRTNEAYKAYVPPSGALTNCYRMVYDKISGNVTSDMSFNWRADAQALTVSRLDMSRNGQFLLVSTPTNGIYVKPLSGGDAYRIIAGTASQACLSPDGRRVAFIQTPAGESDTELYVAELLRLA